MAPGTRGALCLLIGMPSGFVLGSLFAPDPTGVLPFVLTLIIGAVLTAYLYWSDWLRDAERTT